MKNRPVNKNLKWIVLVIFCLVCWIIYSTTNGKSKFIQTNGKPNQLKLVQTNEESNACCKKAPDYVSPQLFQPGVFITPQEADYIINKSKKNMKRSTLLSKTKISNRDRISKTHWMKKNDPVTNKIISRVLDHIKKTEGLDIPFENCESLQVVHYGPGNFYRPHFDTCVSNDKEICKQFRARGGERIRTVIVGLNEQGKDYQGGYTSFPNLGVKYRLPKSSALMFHTLDKQMKGNHKLSLHGGDDVTQGEKWIANI